MPVRSIRSTSIIGGADGPTAIFLAGKGSKDKNLFRRMKHAFRQSRYLKRRKKAEQQITPCAHSMQETIEYMVKKYGAVERDRTSSLYEERKRQMRISLIQRENPDLIDWETPTPPPNVRTDATAMREWMARIHEQTALAVEKAANLPDELFPIDYHIYWIDRGTDGSVEVEIEMTRGIVGISSAENHLGKRPWQRSGRISAITRDIYLYYGVTAEDIKTRSERYQTLITVLASP